MTILTLKIDPVKIRLRLKIAKRKALRELLSEDIMQHEVKDFAPVMRLTRLIAEDQAYLTKHEAGVEI